VVAVIINHFSDSLLPSGYLGVDIFFVISGFVITASLVRQQSKNCFDFLVGFYFRRVKRLIPALVVFVGVVGGSICLFDPTPELSLKTGASSLLGLSNLYLLRHSTDYFAQSTALNPFTHTWSLGVEEQFYFLFPLMVWFSGITRSATIGSRRLLMASALLAVASLAAFVVLYPNERSAAYFLMPTRFWELGAGCLLFLGLKHANHATRLLKNGPSLLATAGLAGVLFAPLSWAVPATVAAVLLAAVLIASLRPGTAAFAFFANRNVAYVGRTSYSLYLWHWGVLSLSRWTIGIDWWLAPFQIALMVLLAVISYRFVETPLRRSVWSASPLLSIGAGLTASAGACALLLVVSMTSGGRLYLGNLLEIPTPPHLERTWWADLKTGQYLEHCHVEGKYSAALLDDCLDVPPGNDGTVYLIGDSHARNYLPALRKLFTEHSTAYLTMGGCAFHPTAMMPAYLNQEGRLNCALYVEETAEYLLQKVRSGDLVFVGQRLYKLPERQTVAYVAFVTAFALRLQEKGVRTVLLDGTFPPELDPQQCTALPWQPFGNRHGCSVDSETVSKAYARFDELAYEASNSIDHLYYAPLRLGLCTEAVCGQSTATGRPIWHDRGHITEQAAEELAPLLLARLTEQGFYRESPENRSIVN
jgi:peptidoglycan/LPS O-acetylase OafA/YrhL